MSKKKNHSGNRMYGAQTVSWGYIEKVVIEHDMTFSDLARLDGRSTSYYCSSAHEKRGNKLPVSAIRFIKAVDYGETIPEPISDPNWENIRKLGRRAKIQMKDLSRRCGFGASLRTVKYYTAGLVLILMDEFKCTREDIVFKPAIPVKESPTRLLPVSEPVQMSIEDIDEETFDIETSKPGRKASVDTPQIRFTSRFSDLEWAYLSEKHWVERTHVNDILREFVREDMKRHPEIMKNIK